MGEIDGSNKDDALHQKEDIITGPLQEELLKLSTTPTGGEHQKTEEVARMDLVKTCTDQVMPVT